jgi:hypothetical protein
MDVRSLVRMVGPLTERIVLEKGPLSKADVTRVLLHGDYFELSSADVKPLSSKCRGKEPSVKTALYNFSRKIDPTRTGYFNPGSYKIRWVKTVPGVHRGLFVPLDQSSSAPKRTATDRDIREVGRSKST